MIHWRIIFHIIIEILYHSSTSISLDSDMQIDYFKHTVLLYYNTTIDKKQMYQPWVVYELNEYRISSNKTRGYYFFTGPSNAGIIRTRVLIEGWYYYQDLLIIDIKTRKP